MRYEVWSRARGSDAWYKVASSDDLDLALRQAFQLWNYGNHTQVLDAVAGGVIIEHK